MLTNPTGLLFPYPHCPVIITRPSDPRVCAEHLKTCDIFHFGFLPPAYQHLAPQHQGIDALVFYTEATIPSDIQSSKWDWDSCIRKGNYLIKMLDQSNKRAIITHPEWPIMAYTSRGFNFIAKADITEIGQYIPGIPSPTQQYINLIEI